MGERSGNALTSPIAVWFWCPCTLTFHVETRHQNILNSMIFQYTNMTNEVHLNGMNKMGDFSMGKSICIYLFRYHL